MFSFTEVLNLSLPQRYAVPLRKLARNKDTAVIPLYEAQRLFGNIGEIVGANKAFLNQLELLMKNGVKSALKGLGDAMYQHMTCCSCYNEYFANIEKAKHIESTMSKNKGFKEYGDRVKSTTTGIGNVGLRELLMEPVQRIPRYTMMLNGLIKYIPHSDPQRIRLEEAVVLASHIASCEADDKTKRAAVLWSLTRHVEDFPAELVSVKREYIDCIDVDDFPAESLIAQLGPAALFSPGTSQMATRTLNVSLFLFDDKLVIVKRNSSNASGRQLAGLDDLSKLADQMKAYTEKHGSSTFNPSTALLSYGSKKGELAFRGMIDLMDVQASDLGGPDFQLAFSKAPSNVSGDKWVNRPVRQYAVPDIISGGSAHAAPARMQKTRFLENLWRAQALLKTKEHRSHARCEVFPASFDSMDGSVILPRQIIYWNVYSRQSYMQEQKRVSTARLTPASVYPYLISTTFLQTAVVLHVDLSESANLLELGQDDAPPHACVRIDDLDLDACLCYARLYVRGGELGHESIDVALTSLHEFMAQVRSELPPEWQDFRRASADPSTPANSRRSGVVEFGRNLIQAATPGTIRSTTDSEGYSTTGRRSKLSSFSYANSTTRTTSTMATTVASSSVSRERANESLDQRESPSPRKLIKKNRPSSVGAFGPTSPVGTPSKSSTRPMSPEARSPRREVVSPPVSPSRAESAVRPQQSPQRQTHAHLGERPNMPSSPAGQPVLRTFSGSKRAAPADATPNGNANKRSAYSREEDGNGQSPSRGSPSRAVLAPSPRVNVNPASPARRQGDRWQSSLKRQQYRARERRKAFSQMRGFLEGIEQSRASHAAKESVQQQRLLNQQLLKWLADAESDFGAEAEDIGVLLDVNLADLTGGASNSELQMLKEEAAKVQPLRTRLLGMERKCELLTALEADGRLENTELHKVSLMSRFIRLRID